MARQLNLLPKIELKKSANLPRMRASFKVKLESHFNSLSQTNYLMQQPRQNTVFLNM